MVEVCTINNTRAISQWVVVNAFLIVLKMHLSGIRPYHRPCSRVVHRIGRVRDIVQMEVQVRSEGIVVIPFGNSAIVPSVDIQFNILPSFLIGCVDVEVVVVSGTDIHLLVEH